MEREEGKGNVKERESGKGEECLQDGQINWVGKECGWGQ